MCLCLCVCVYVHSSQTSISSHARGQSHRLLANVHPDVCFSTLAARCRARLSLLHRLAAGLSLGSAPACASVCGEPPSLPRCGRCLVPAQSPGSGAAFAHAALGWRQSCFSPLRLHRRFGRSIPHPQTSSAHLGMVFWAVLRALFYGALLLRVWQLACTILQARLRGCAVSMTGGAVDSGKCCGRESCSNLQSLYPRASLGLTSPPHPGL